MADPVEHLLWHPWLRSSRFARRYRYVRRRLRQWPDMEGLEAAGLRLGRDVRIMAGAYVDPDFAWLIEIGDGSGLSYDVVVLAHDASTRRHLGYTRVAPVRIGAQVFVGARAIILPGVTIGDGAVIAAGSVVRNDVEAGTMVGGVPARVLGRVDEYVERHRDRQERHPVWPKEAWTVAGGITPENKQRMWDALLESGEGYIR